MTPSERADLLVWLGKLPIEQLKEVSGHVNSVITHKRGAKLRLLNLGAQVVFYGDVLPQTATVLKTGTKNRLVGTVVKINRSSVEVELTIGNRTKLDVDEILGLHVGGLEYAPLESAQPLGFPQVPAVLEQQVSVQAPVEFGPTARDGLPGGDLEEFNPPIDWQQPE